MLRISKNAANFKNCWEFQILLRIIKNAEKFKKCWEFQYSWEFLLLRISKIAEIFTEQSWDFYWALPRREMLTMSKNRWVLLRITQYCWELLDNTIQKLCVRPWHINWIRPWWIRGHSVKAVFFLYKALGTTDNTKAKSYHQQSFLKPLL